MLSRSFVFFSLYGSALRFLLRSEHMTYVIFYLKRHADTSTRVRSRLGLLGLGLYLILEVRTVYLARSCASTPCDAELIRSNLFRRRQGRESER